MGQGLAQVSRAVAQHRTDEGFPLWGTMASEPQLKFARFRQERLMANGLGEQGVDGVWEKTWSAT